VNVTISTAILLITTIIAASIFTGAALTQLYSFQNTFKEVSSRNQQIFASSIVIIGETKNASSPTSIIVWVKNIGRTSFPLTDAAYWDLFIVFPDGTYQRFTYNNSTTQNNSWGVKILNDKGTIGVWENGETIQITAYTNSIASGSYEVRLTVSNGVTAQDKFSFS
jgi:archaellum component FlaG (FlaF/FlaG flagellin family)